METLVGGGLRDEFPKDGYNCFELRGAGHVANMYVENFREWQKRTGAKMVEVVIFNYGPGEGRSACLIVDNRIEESWLREDICTTCISFNLAAEIEEWKKEHGKTL
jgi:hypothetical protein